MRALFISIAIFTVGIFGLWFYVMKHSADILEFDHPSRDIGHAIKKGIFIDSLEILNPDTIRTDQFEPNDILPKTSWIEKKTLWKSGNLNLDSLSFYQDTVILIVNFEKVIKNQRGNSKSSGYYNVEFQNSYGDTAFVYFGEKIQLTFSTPIAIDSIELKTQDGQKILLKRRT